MASVTLTRLYSGNIQISAPGAFLILNESEFREVLAGGEAALASKPGPVVAR